MSTVNSSSKNAKVESNQKPQQDTKEPVTKDIKKSFYSIRAVDELNMLSGETKCRLYKSLKSFMVKNIQEMGPHTWTPSQTVQIGNCTHVLLHLQCLQCILMLWKPMRIWSQSCSARRVTDNTFISVLSSELAPRTLATVRGKKVVVILHLENYQLVGHQIHKCKSFKRTLLLGCCQPYEKSPIIVNTKETMYIWKELKLRYLERLVKRNIHYYRTREEILNICCYIIEIFPEVQLSWEHIAGVKVLRLEHMSSFVTANAPGHGRCCTWELRDSCNNTRSHL